MLKKIIVSLVLIGCSFSYAQQSYYNDVNLNLTGLSLKSALATKITNTHVNFLSYTPQVWNASKITDVNPQNSQQVLLIYGWENATDSDVTNDRARGIDDNSGSNGDWNREHVYPRSLGTPNLGDEGPGSDAHHLRPSDVQRNSSRGNKKFASGSGTASYSVNGGWYPGDEWKGDVARMMMYMYLRYGDRCLPTNVGIGSDANTPDKMIDLFLQWNADDPVSDIEKQRNTFHENTSNTDAQGNRNPFIDNPRLATRIWGGPDAEDIWGIYTNTDTEAPSVPTNVMASNITTFSADISWTASTDNVGVSSYEVYIDGNLSTTITTTAVTLSNLASNTNYSIQVLAKDIAENKSALSTALNMQTLEDTEAPSIPSNIMISNESTTSFIVSWSASTDNTAVTEYDIYVDNGKIGSSAQTTFTVTNLSPSTTYNVQVLAKDAAGNSSNLSTAVNATTNGNNSAANEIFFSEYIEGSSNNKALELVNLTNADIDLSSYSVKRQPNGGEDGGVWQGELQLSGNIKAKDVFVIINGSAALQKLIDEADFVQPNAEQTNWGEPINYNGNDPVGLFKNGVLIDIIGTYNAGSANFAKDKTLRRKSGVSQPNATFDLANEWDVYAKDNIDDIGSHSAIALSTSNFELDNIRVYPNPSNNGKINIKLSDASSIKSLVLYSVIGSKVYEKKSNFSKQTEISNLKGGIYLLKINNETKSITKKVIIN